MPLEPRKAAASTYSSDSSGVPSSPKLLSGNPSHATCAIATLLSTLVRVGFIDDKLYCKTTACATSIYTVGRLSTIRSEPMCTALDPPAPTPPYTAASAYLLRPSPPPLSLCTSRRGLPRWRGSSTSSSAARVFRDNIEDLWRDCAPRIVRLNARYVGSSGLVGAARRPPR